MEGFSLTPNFGGGALKQRDLSFLIASHCEILWQHWKTHHISLLSSYRHIVPKAFHLFSCQIDRQTDGNLSVNNKLSAGTLWTDRYREAVWHTHTHWRKEKQDRPTHRGNDRSGLGQDLRVFPTLFHTNHRQRHCGDESWSLSGPLEQKSFRQLRKPGLIKTAASGIVLVAPRSSGIALRRSEVPLICLTSHPFCYRR